MVASLQKVGEGDVQDRVSGESPLSTSSYAREERDTVPPLHGDGDYIFGEL